MHRRLASACSPALPCSVRDRRLWPVPRSPGTLIAGAGCDVWRARARPQGIAHEEVGWGSSGYVYGNGKFTQGAVHVDTVLEGGYYDGYDADGNLISLGFFEIDGFDMRAVRNW